MSTSDLCEDIRVHPNMATVLIVDDQRETGHLLARIIKYLGHKGIHVPSGEDALAFVRDSLPDAVKNTGRPSLGAPLTTAGGLTFIGATDDSRFRAFDTKTGKEIWTYKLDYSAHASPISYRGKDGKQYVAVVATGGSFLRSPAGGDSVVVFALPE